MRKIEEVYMRINFGNLTDEQTTEIAIEALENLGESRFIELIVQYLRYQDATMIEELIANLEILLGEKGANK